MIQGRPLACHYQTGRKLSDFQMLSELQDEGGERPEHATFMKPRKLRCPSMSGAGKEKIMGQQMLLYLKICADPVLTSLLRCLRREGVFSLQPHGGCQATICSHVAYISFAFDFMNDFVFTGESAA